MIILFTLKFNLPHRNTFVYLLKSINDFLKFSLDSSPESIIEIASINPYDMYHTFYTQHNN